MEALRTDRLVLRAWTIQDADFVFDMYARWAVQQFIGLVPTVMESRDQAVALIGRWQDLVHPVHRIWAVTGRGSGRLHGTLLLKSIPASGTGSSAAPSGDTEIGWHFHPDSWGHGCASEAAAAVLQYAFGHGLDEVVAVTAPANLASQRVCERIGMTRRGLTTKYYDATCELFSAIRPGA